MILHAPCLVPRSFHHHPSIQQSACPRPAIVLRDDATMRWWSNVWLEGCVVANPVASRQLSVTDSVSEIVDFLVDYNFGFWTLNVLVFRGFGF